MLTIMSGYGVRVSLSNNPAANRHDERVNSKIPLGCGCDRDFPDVRRKKLRLSHDAEVLLYTWRAIR